MEVVALPFPLAYEVSCRARTGSVLHKVSPGERFVIRPVFRMSETLVPPCHFLFASDFGRHSNFQSGLILLPCPRGYQP